MTQVTRAIERTDYQIAQVKDRLNVFLSRPTDDSLNDVLVYLKSYQEASQAGIFSLPKFSFS
jgi:hypothetical protein